MGGVVIGLILVALGSGLALNLGGVADIFANHGASLPTPPPGVRGAVTDPNQIRLIGGVFAFVGLMAIAAAVGVVH